MKDECIGTRPGSPRLSISGNQEEIKALEAIVEELRGKVHRLELNVLPPKKRNPWMG